MNPMNLEQLVRNVDRRLDRVEQILPALVTKEEFEQKIATLATKEELREEFERSRRHTQVLFESLMDRISIVADGFAATDVKINQEIRPRLDGHERRITALENADRPAASDHRD